MQTYNVDQAEKMPPLKNSLDGQTLILAEQEACKATENIFETLNNTDERQCNETVKSLQYCKLNKHNSENAKLQVIRS